MKIKLFAKKANKRYLWCAARVTHKQMDSLMKMREETKIPVSMLVANAIEEYICRNTNENNKSILQ